jgi:molybdate transport system substrate-binding protein
LRGLFYCDALFAPQRVASHLVMAASGARQLRVMAERNIGAAMIAICRGLRPRRQAMKMIRRHVPVLLAIAALAVCPAGSGAARADTLKVLTAGAFQQALLSVLPRFEAAGHEVRWEADTVGGLTKRIDGGEAFDVVFASPAALKAARDAGKIGDITDLARVGVGVAVKQGAPKPDIASVESFKAALQAAKAVAYIDPASGGSSGIYVAALIDRLGIRDEIRAKSLLVKGGYSAERVVSGEADLAIQQISELLPVKGAVLLGPLPAPIQSYTIYSAAPSAATTHAEAAKALIALLHSQDSNEAIAAAGMEPIDPKPSDKSSGKSADKPADKPAEKSSTDQPTAK